MTGNGTNTGTRTNEPIAIVGIGCRLPGGVRGPASFWDFLVNRGDAIGEIPGDRWGIDGFYDADPNTIGRSKTKWGAFLEDIYGFDPTFFDISPREAENMDPQQSGLLQVVYEALQDAQVTMRDASRAVTGVFVGITTSDFRSLLECDQVVPANDIYAGTGAALCIAANRISHRFNLTGPSMALDTACSSSMVAVDLACRNINDGACNMAIAAGVNVLAAPTAFILFSNAKMLSPTGRLSTFDAAANGYVRGEGFGAVVLKPLSKALADGDDIYGLVRSTAVNQDGQTKTLTAPSQDAQIAMLETLCASGGVSPEDIGFVECHGTGTPTGDPIEAGAVGRVFGKDRRVDPLMIGSVKPNVGHLESAAGITGFIKGALVAKYGAVPPNINYSKPNPNIPFEALNLTVPGELSELPELGGSRFAVVNSFGFGGTNASALIESWQPAASNGSPIGRSRGGALTVDKPSVVPVPVSAASEDALQAYAGELAAALDDGGTLSGAEVADVAANLAHGRDHLGRRAVFLASNNEELKARLAQFSQDGTGADTEKGALPTIVAGQPSTGGKVCFTFSGQGSQWWAMGRGLMEDEPVYRKAVEAFDALFAPLAGWSVIDEMMKDEETSRADQSVITQPTICALQIGLAALWRHRGVTPDMVIGHSLGEVAAAYVAGAIDLETAVRYIHKRSLIRTMMNKDGGMAVIGLPAAELEGLLAECEGIEIAGYNAPTTVTISGDKTAVEAFVAELQAERPDVFVRDIRTDTAWHSYHLEEAEVWFRKEVGEITSEEPAVPFVSTVSGRPECFLDTNYWWRNLRSPVRFQEAVETAVALGAEVFLELAPHRTLSGPTTQSAQSVGATVSTVSTLNRAHDDQAAMAAAIGALHVRGVDIDWSRVLPGDHPRLPLPSYPWSNGHYAKLPEEAKLQLFRDPGHPLLGSRLISPTTMWRSIINLQQFKFIADHRLRDDCLFPAAGYLEMMLAAGRELFGEGTIEIEDVRIFETLFISQDGAVALQTVHDPDRDYVRIYSRGQEEGAEWVLRSEGRVRRVDMTVEKKTPEPLAKPIPFPDEFWYHTTGPQSFIEFGPTFQSMKNVAVEHGGYRALANVNMHPSLKDRFDSYLAHPAMLDTALQLTDHNVATLGDTENGSFDAEGRFVGSTHSIPIAIGRVVFFAPFQEAMTLDVKHRLALGRPVGNRGMFRAADGTALVMVEDVTTKGIPITGLGTAEGTVKSSVVEECFAPITFVSDDAAKQQASEIGRVIVLAGEVETVAPVVEGLVAAGAAVEVVGRERVEAADLAGIKSKLEALIDGGDAPSSIVFAQALDSEGLDAATETDRLSQVAEREIMTLMALGQIFERRNEVETPTVITTLTRMARQLPDDSDVPVSGLARTPLVGLVRTITAECESHPFVQIDVDDEALGNPELLIQAMFGQAGEGEIVLRGGNVFAPRLERREFDDLPGMTKAVTAEDRRTNYVVTMRNPGVIDALEVQEADMPVIGDDDALLEIGAVGLNFRDVMAVTGLLPAEAEPEPAWRNLGMEYGATVTAVGANVTNLKPGDRVMGMGRRCMQRFLAMPAVALDKLPDHLSLEDASTIPSVFATAHHALNHIARIRKGEKVLIHVATGGVGLAAIQLCKRAGVEIFATAGSEEKRDFLRSLGIEHVMNSRTLDFADEIMRITDGRGVDVVLNSLPGAYIEKGIDVLAPYGRFVEIGKRDVYADKPLGLKALRRNIQLAVVDMAALGFERPELMGEIMSELVAMFEGREIEPLPATTFPASRSADAVRYMSQAKHIGKVVVSFDELSIDIRVSTDKAFTLSGDASYLVTGGSRGFGIAVADWLSRKGAGRIVLASRSGRVDEAETEKITSIEERGTKVDNIALDVADADAVNVVIAELSSADMPLRGIVHGAAVIDDALLSQLDDDLVRRVVRPKLAGAWNLHKALEATGTELDFLLSFSSTSQLFGSRGQAAYVAANAFLDGFAHYRRHNGQAAFTVDWGPLGGTGVVSRNDQLASYMQSMGMYLVEADDATSSLESFLRVDRASLAYTAIDWAKFRRANPRLEANPRMAPLVADVGATTTRVRTEIMALPREEWPQRIDTFLKGEVAKVLKVDADQVQSDRPMSELGLDSLSSFELKSCIDEELSLEMSVSKFLQATTIEKLVDVVIELIEAEKARAESQAQADDAQEAGVADQSGGSANGFVASDRQLGLMAIERALLTSDEARASLRSAADLIVSPSVDGDRLQDALDALAAGQPMLRLKVDPTPGAADGGLYLGTAPRVVIHDNAMQDVRPVLEVNAGDLLRIDVFAMAPGSSQVVMQAHAACMDRMSLARFADLLMREYAEPGSVSPDEGDGDAILSALSRQRFNAEDAKAVADRAFWYETMTPWLPGLHFGRRKRAVAPIGLGRNTGKCQHHARSLDLDWLAGRDEKERESVLLTAFGLALSDVSGASDVMVAHQSRVSGDNVARLGPFSGEWPVGLRACATTQPAAQLARVHRHLAAAENRRAFDAHAMEALFAGEMREAGVQMPNAAFAYTRLGVARSLPLSTQDGFVHIGGLDVEGGLEPAEGGLHDVRIEVQDMGDVARIELAYDASALDEATARAVLRRLVARMRELSGQSPDGSPRGTRRVDRPVASVASQNVVVPVPVEVPAVAEVNSRRPQVVAAQSDLKKSGAGRPVATTAKKVPAVAPIQKETVTAQGVQQVADYPVGRFEAVVLDSISDGKATPEYHRSWTIGQALRISRPIDTARLNEAFAKVVRRHELLRSRFAKRADGWRLIVEDKHRTGPQVTDLGEVSDAEIRVWIDTALGERFDVENGPLFKIDVLKCGARGDVLVMRVHHLVTDGWSQVVVSDELVRASFGLPFSGPEPMGYGEYLRRFERVADAALEETHEAYWRNLMLPALPAPRLGRIAKGRAPNLSGSDLGPVGKVIANMDADGLERMRRATKDAGCTMSNLVNAAFATVLAKRGDVDGVYLNTPVAARVHPDMRSFVGFACDFFPVRCDVANASSLEDLARGLGEQLRASLQHAPASATKCDPAFDRIVNDAGGHLRQFECGMLIPETAGRQSLLAPLMKAGSDGVIQLGPVEIEVIDFTNVRQTSAELDLRTIERESGMEFIFAFDTLAFDEAEVREIAADVQRLLGMAEAECPMSSADERDVELRIA